MSKLFQSKNIAKKLLKHDIDKPLLEIMFIYLLKNENSLYEIKKESISALIHDTVSKVIEKKQEKK